MTERAVARDGRRQVVPGVPLLVTKLAVPQPPDPLVLRPRLFDALDRGVARPVTLLGAPPGSGKTSLLSSWVSYTRHAGRRVAWLSLDSSDNDPTSFWGYVVAALRSIEPQLGVEALEQLSRKDGIDAFLMLLLSDLEQLDRPALLVLDDAHVVESPAVWKDVAYLVDHLPSALRIVFGTRVDPPLPLHRLRVRGRLTEIRERDLRFDIAEAGELLASRERVDVRRDQLAVLVQRTEGWAAGLHLAALSLRDRDDIDAFVQRFAGDDRAIVDFLVEEVFERQSPHMRDFLLATSVLERFTAPLCDAVTGRSDAYEMLRRLEAANLFLIGLDTQRRWYRYHELFAQMLHHILHMQAPERERVLHVAAGDWYASEGDIPTAVGHYLAAGEYDKAWAAVSANYLSYLLAGRQATVHEWISAFPDAYLAQDPNRLVDLIGTLTVGGQPDEAARWLRRAERAAADRADRSYAGRLALLWALCHFQWGEVRQSLAAANRGVELLAGETEEFLTERRLHFVLLRLHTLVDDFARARAVHAAIPRPTARGRDTVLYLGTLAVVAWGEGHLREAEQLTGVALEAAEQAGLADDAIANGETYLVLGGLRRERNLLEAAEPALETVLRMGERAGFAHLIVGGQLELARVWFAQGRASESFDLLAQARQPIHARALPRALAWRIDACEADLRLRVGDTARARELLAGLPEGIPARLLAARLALVTGAPRDVREHLTPSAVGSATLRERIEAAVLLARAGPSDSEAERQLRRAVELAAPEQYIQTFLGEGSGLVPLLRRLHARSPSAFSARLMQAFADEAGAPSAEPPPGLVEPLSERERAVLRYLPTLLSNDEIAAELFVSVNTVKTHLKSVYRKLAVSRRREAVRRARELGLLG